LNIFYLDKNTKICAQYHCDKHVVKMLLESAQLLSTAHQVSSENLPEITPKHPDIPDLMKPSYVKHPCNIWVRQSVENYFWLAELAWELCKEYTYRYNKIHKRQETIVSLLDTWPKHLPHTGFTPPPQCMPDECKMGDTVESYQEYYRQKKANFATWRHRPIPTWFLKMEDKL